VNAFRVFYLSAGVLFLLAIAPSFMEHAMYLIGGEGLAYILRDRWDIAAVNIGFFLVFLALLRYRSRVDWRGRNIYAAFIVALFVEMYGFPLTAYFVASYFGPVNVDYQPVYSMDVSFMGAQFTLPTLMIVGGFVTVIGLILIVLGWYEIYRHKTGLVTNGVYKHTRNPQYLGMLMVTFGWIIHWPTILTLLMWPALAYTYYRLAQSEEKEMGRLYPKDFDRYSKTTPMFL
jgi:methanethiol S-methyltransferase